MSRQNLILTVGVAGLLLSVSGSAFAVYYGTNANVSGYGTCPMLSIDNQCPPPTYIRPVYDGTDYIYGLSHSYDSSGLYSNIGTGSIYHLSNINGTVSSPGAVVAGTGGSSGSCTTCGTSATDFWSTGGSSMAAAAFGQLRAYATATAEIDASMSPVTANAYAQASWYDTLTITSSTLNPGDPVQLHGTMHLDGRLSITDPTGTSDSSLTSTSDNAQGIFGVIWQSNQFGSHSASCAATSLGGALPCMQEYTIYTAVGDTIMIRGVLTTSAFANAGRNVVYYPDSNPHGPFQSSRATADFSNTGFITLESLTTGATFVADSGSLYGPVPVPAAVWLFGSGLLGLVGVARRRVHTSRHRGHEGVPQAASSGLRLRRPGRQDQNH